MDSSSRPSIAALRDAVRRAVDASSLRPVAEKVGMSHSGLRAFLKGGTPRVDSEHKLREWYLKHGGGGLVMSLETARICTALLLTEIPEARRAAARRELLEFVETLHRRNGSAPPGWVKEIRNEPAE